jgi:hypothetical protein
VRVSVRLYRKITIILCVILLGITPAFTSAMDVIIEGPTPDITPPELKGLSISLNEATPNNPVKLTAEVSDDLSGVDSVYGYYLSPNNTSKSINFYLNQTTNKYEATVQFSLYDDPGEWKLYRISLSDKKDNSITYYDVNSNNSKTFDYSSYFINVTGVTAKPPREDFVPPLLSDIKVTNISPVTTGESAYIVARMLPIIFLVFPV